MITSELCDWWKLITCPYIYMSLDLASVSRLCHYFVDLQNNISAHLIKGISCNKWRTANISLPVMSSIFCSSKNTSLWVTFVSVNFKNWRCILNELLQRSAQQPPCMWWLLQGLEMLIRSSYFLVRILTEIPQVSE